MDRIISLELWSVVLVCVLVYVILKLSNYIRIIYMGFQIPGPRPVPLLGNVLLLTEHDGNISLIILICINLLVYYYKSKKSVQQSLNFSSIVLNKVGATAYKNYGPVMRLWCLVYPLFLVLEPHDVQSILSTKKHVDKMFFYKLLHNFLGNGLITSSGNIS